ncbi:site-specific DNA-methyltransferase [Chitinophaga arvensicola]|uniref:site-specific DNA-methyltransferase (adenine-specific) n=1 Tax=Chitinophaga arvensicola TaxID=29529 RepID=A0A1I0R307_9BACT|nr:DNA methyltransferase [Chitinophaga arvensicola]SEW34744.1 adenine-specific DNA-methyltransferase [Chitinophaga arvensicola]
MNGLSLTPQQEKLKALQKLLPEVFAEDKLDWEKLKATLGEAINFENERYVLNWAGKAEAFKVLQSPTSKTLVPAKAESIDFDKTENIFIEGENLEVLKTLQKSYFGKVKLIYIDPPYNTGNDSFIYPDKFAETLKEYQERVGDKDEEGYMTRDGLFRKNSKENGQYHSNWLSMMMPRLFLAKNLLRQDGLIFVSIDDNEVHNLRLLMNEIFGEEHFVAEFPRITKKAGKTTDLIAKNTDYVICFSKSDNVAINKNTFSDDGYKYSDEYEEERGKYKLSQTLDYGSIQYSPSLDYEIELENFIFRPGGVSNLEMIERKKRNPSSDFCWRWSKDLFQFGLENGFVVVKESVKGKRIYTKTYQNATIGKNSKGYFVDIIERAKSTSTLEFIENVYSNDNSRKDLDKLFDEKVFDYSKPVSLIKKIISNGSNAHDLILDFFAGSGTTAQAVMELNKEDGNNRKYICVQLPELCDEKSEAFKAGYKTIADISKERIRRAGRKIQIEIDASQQNAELRSEKTELPKPDLGFKVLKLADSNFKQWQSNPGKDARALVEQMKLFVDPIAEHATIESMVYEFLLKSGKSLNSKIEDCNDYFIINNNELVLLLKKATPQIIEGIIARKPQKVIALDSLFKDNDQLKTNSVLQMGEAGIQFKTI